MNKARCYGCGEFDETCRCGNQFDIPGAREEHKPWLCRKMAHEIAKESGNSHNLRAAARDSPEAVTAYESARSRGAGDAIDWAVTHPDGTQYMLGFHVA